MWQQQSGAFCAIEYNINRFSVLMSLLDEESNLSIFFQRNKKTGLQPEKLLSDAHTSERAREMMKKCTGNHHEQEMKRSLTKNWGSFCFINTSDDDENLSLFFVRVKRKISLENCLLVPCVSNLARIFIC